jgi:hypothetical protein
VALNYGCYSIGPTRARDWTVAVLAGFAGVLACRRKRKWVSGDTEPLPVWRASGPKSQLSLLKTRYWFKLLDLALRPDDSLGACVT